MLSLWNQQYFATSPKLSAQKLWNFCEMVFIEIRAETDVSTGMEMGSILLKAKTKADGKHFTKMSTISHV